MAVVVAEGGEHAQPAVHMLLAVLGFGGVAAHLGDQAGMGVRCALRHRVVVAIVAVVRRLAVANHDRRLGGLRFRRGIAAGHCVGTTQIAVL
ncbi:MAG: hypothetical protein OXF72_04265, partial [Gammaproteobacteria bacterium]|nr:hypothetical protein [Gammaproteobacteria bacterium]